MKVCVLSSGSKGNCTYVETSNHKILIDVGTSFAYITNSLKEIGTSIEEIDTILITHTHDDHVHSLKAITRRYNVNVYISELMVSELKFELTDYIEPAEKIYLDDTIITTIKTSHDRLDSNAYLISENDTNILYITDTGYINQKYFDEFKNLDLYIFESNHDIPMLMHGKKRYDIRMRVLGDEGHLSNIQASEYLNDFIGDKTKYVILAHISEDDNTEELALSTLSDKLKENNKSFDNVIAARQNVRTELIEL